MPVSQETLDQIALSRAEYDLIVAKLEREPTPVELGLFGALWSEHCGYKHSRPLLKGFPTSGEAVRVKAGEENAGVVSIGNGWNVVFKVESHNHPSAVEPYQGAATGVGGIVRDILAMGARPVALLNSLRFGPLTSARNRYLFSGVVSGISGYGNCIGVPDVGGEVVFADSYAGNPLVNAMCVGLLPDGALMRAAASTPGATLMVVGSATGRDGIHGASGLASRSFESEEELRPTVQVGDPFLEKVLIEACLEAAVSGHLEGLQDMGAAGITSSVMEAASRGGTGVDLDVSLVPRREPGMNAYEVMLSESQERMLLIVKPGHEGAIQELFAKWDLPVTAVGTVTDDGIGRVRDGEQVVAQVAIETLVEAPQYRIPSRRPAYLDRVQGAPLPPAPAATQAGALLTKLLASPNIASRRAVYRQYDHQVQTNTLVTPGAGDAAVVRVRGAGVALAVALDGPGRSAYLDPYTGGALAVAEACRNVACAGGRPLAVTDCLNFGNPTKPEVYYQMEEAVRGMADACRALGVPVVSGNVSLYNESHGTAIYPTPVVGALGLLGDPTKALSAGFGADGDAIILLGTGTLAQPDASLGGSEYLADVHGQVIGKPALDLDAEARLQGLMVRMAGEGLAASAHDCSDGGLAVALAESAIIGGHGADCTGALFEGTRWDAALFGEAASRIVVSARPQHVDALLAAAHEAGVPALALGTVGGERVRLAGLVDEPLAALTAAWSGGLEAALAG